MESKSFVELFVVRGFHEDLGTIFNFPMLTDPQATFVMFSLHYIQCPRYLRCTMFPFPGIL
jgi:predicted SPOUT superfamily RNA methylase MTH1